VKPSGAAMGRSGRGDREEGWDEAAETGASETAPAIEARRRPRRARRYKVVIHNDDYTSMEFVVAMLMKHFHMPPAEAMHVMLLVHHQGAGTAGVYTRDVAETKVAEVTAEAHEEGMPLLLTAEPLGAGEADGPGSGETGGGPGSSSDHDSDHGLDGAPRGRSLPPSRRRR
jgi:ATP-dependent Clp protease adaptor protein ClpS